MTFWVRIINPFKMVADGSDDDTIIVRVKILSSKFLNGSKFFDAVWFIEMPCLSV